MYLYVLSSRLALLCYLVHRPTRAPDRACSVMGAHRYYGRGASEWPNSKVQGDGGAALKSCASSSSRGILTARPRAFIVLASTGASLLSRATIYIR